MSYASENPDDLPAQYGFFSGGLGRGGYRGLIPMSVYNPGITNPDGSPIKSDLAGLMADPGWAKIAPFTRIADEQYMRDSRDPNGPGNGEGGSDLANIMKGVAFIGGGAALTGGLGGLFGGGELAANTALPAMKGAGYSGAVGGAGGAGASMSALPSLNTLSSGASLLNAVGGESNMGFNGGEAGVPTTGVTVPSSFGSGLGTAAAQAGAGTALSRILNGTGTSADFASILGAGGSALLGAVGASKQQDQLKGLADQFMQMGAPSRGRYEASFAPGFTMSNDPGYMDSLNQSAKATLHGLSVNGNPAGSPNAWTQTLQDLQQKTAYPALQNYRNQNAATSGIGAFSSAAPETSQAAIGAGSNVFGAIGKGIANITNPPQTLSDWINANKGSTIFG